MEISCGIHGIHWGIGTTSDGKSPFSHGFSPQIPWEIPMKNPLRMGWDPWRGLAEVTIGCASDMALKKDVLEWAAGPLEP